MKCTSNVHDRMVIYKLNTSMDQPDVVNGVIIITKHTPKCEPEGSRTHSYKHKLRNPNSYVTDWFEPILQKQIVKNMLAWLTIGLLLMGIV